MHRSAALLGLAAVPLAGCALLRDRVRVMVNGCVDAPVLPATGVVVAEGALHSRHALGAIRYAIAFAAKRATIDRVIYLLPGRSASARDALTLLGFAGAFSAAMRAHPVLRHTALAAIDAGESYFHPRRSGENRLAVVSDEFPALVTRITGARPRREALIGMSMGGYGALLAAERDPARYRAVAVAGPAIFPSYEDERRSVGHNFNVVGPPLLQDDRHARGAELVRANGRPACERDQPGAQCRADQRAAR